MSTLQVPAPAQRLAKQTRGQQHAQKAALRGGVVSLEETRGMEWQRRRKRGRRQHENERKECVHDMGPCPAEEGGGASGPPPHTWGRGRSSLGDRRRRLLRLLPLRELAHVGNGNLRGRREGRGQSTGKRCECWDVRNLTSHCSSSAAPSPPRPSCSKRPPPCGTAMPRPRCSPC